MKFDGRISHPCNFLLALLVDSCTERQCGDASDWESSSQLETGEILSHFHAMQKTGTLKRAVGDYVHYGLHSEVSLNFFRGHIVPVHRTRLMRLAGVPVRGQMHRAIPNPCSRRDSSMTIASSMLSMTSRTRMLNDQNQIGLKYSSPYT